jgi:3-oxoacyl-[acyl-carrier-protein] synthase III
MINAVVKSTGSYLPKKILTNDDLAKMVETSDEWISSRTGIKQRHIAAEGEFTSHMACEAAKKALANSNITAEDIDVIIVATTTPDLTFPSVASKVQATIHAKNAAAFDIQAVCSGFLYGMTITEAMIKSGIHKNILLIGADKMSSIIDWTDRKTCILFGDGAGAIIISAENNQEKRGIISSTIKTDGNLEEILYTTGGTSSTGTCGVVSMNGQEVFKHAVQKMYNSMLEVLAKSEITTSEIDWVIPHQANMRIIDFLAKKMNISMDKVANTVSEHANTSAASIPLALDKFATRLKNGDRIIMTAAGGGFTWGSLLLVW